MRTHILQAPCIFCNYNGAGYYQTGTHDKRCPWFNLGGEIERMTLLPDIIARLTEELRVSREEVEGLKEQLETARMRLVACGIAALANTDETVIHRIAPDNLYYSASYGDVCSVVDREIAYRNQIADLTAKLDMETELRIEADRRAGGRWKQYDAERQDHNVTKKELASYKSLLAAAGVQIEALQKDCEKFTTSRPIGKDRGLE